ncbi:hypothetical protein LTR86_000973 [Recurvomyces mirabilis]|nr:hypothetical protein LTR86_000973 [Recurvomyces mirabilis]
MSLTHDSYWRFDVNRFDTDDFPPKPDESMKELFKKLAGYNTMLPKRHDATFYQNQLSRLDRSKPCYWKWTDPAVRKPDLWDMARARRIMDGDELSRTQLRYHSAPVPIEHWTEGSQSMPLISRGQTKEEINSHLISRFEENDQNLVFRIMDLPLELRRAIGNHYFAAFADRPLHLPTTPPLARTSRQMRHDMLPAFSKTCTFDIRLLTQVSVYETGVPRRYRFRNSIQPTRLTLDAHTLHFFAVNAANVLREIRHIRVVHVKQTTFFPKQSSAIRELSGDGTVDTREVTEEKAEWLVSVAGRDKVLSVRCDPASRFDNHTIAADMHHKTERAIDEFFRSLLYDEEGTEVWSNLGINEVSSLRTKLEGAMNNAT